MRIVKAIAVLSLVAMLLLLWPAVVLAQPPLPGCYYGTVLDDKGANVASGTKVAAYDGTVKVAEVTVLTDAGKTVYTMCVPGVDPTNAASVGAKAGDTITFKIGDKTAGQTTKWASGTNTSLNLQIGSLPPTGDETLPVMVGMLALGGAVLTCAGVFGYRRARA